MRLSAAGKNALASILAFGVALGAGLFGTFVVERSIGEGRVLRGVSWGDKGLSGIDERGLRQLFDEEANAFGEAKLTLRLDGKELSSTIEEAGLGVDVDAAVKQSLSAVRAASSYSKPNSTSLDVECRRFIAGAFLQRGQPSQILRARCP